MQKQASGAEAEHEIKTQASFKMMLWGGKQRISTHVT